MGKNPVNWFEIYVQDMARARAFYESVLQIKLEGLNNPGLEMWAFPANYEAYGSSGALVKFEEKSSGVNSTVVYFQCEDCAVEASRVNESGGRVEREKMSIGEYGFIVLASDTDGNMFGLHSAK